jgi:broad specificity phosphatase PhoE
MGGKNKGKKAASTPRNQKSQQAGSKQQASSAAAAGPSRVLLLRHGQSEANATGRDCPDPHLTDLGSMQAKSWKGLIGNFGAEVVLVSPLRRAIQTALFAFDSVDVPVEVVRHARELWWDEQANTPSTPEALNELLATLPRGDAVCGVDAALDLTDVPLSEKESIRALKQELAGRTEETVCIVCHWGVINAMCGAGAENCEVVECQRTPNGQYIVARHHNPRNAPTTR